MTLRIAAGAALVFLALPCACASAAPDSHPSSGRAGAGPDDGRIVVAEAKKRGDSKSDDSKKAGKPQQVGTFGDWAAFVAQSGKDKTCYALATPKERAPGNLKRDPAYVFISYRPNEKVRGEVSIIMGFAIKEGSEPKAEIGGTTFVLAPKGANAWIRNAAEEPQFVEALKKGAKLTVKAASAKGNVTTDTYSLSGISQALDKVQKDCP